MYDEGFGKWAATVVSMVSANLNWTGPSSHGFKIPVVVHPPLTLYVA